MSKYNPFRDYKYFYCDICNKRLHQTPASFSRHRKFHDPAYRIKMAPVWARVGEINRQKLTGKGKPYGSMVKRYGNIKAKNIKKKISRTLKRKIDEGLIKKSYLTIGNGRGLSTLEKIFYNTFLNELWVFNYAIGIKPHISGYPNTYKIDFFNPALNKGIEVDGKIHKLKSRQESDKKKMLFLKSRGYNIRRINEEQISLLKSNGKFEEWLSSY